MIVMIVETDFTPADYAGALLREIDQSPFGCLVEQFRVVRVNSDGRVNILELLGESHRPFEGAALRIAGAHVQHSCHTRGARAHDYFDTISVILRAIDVTV